MYQLILNLINSLINSPSTYILIRFSLFFISFFVKRSFLFHGSFSNQTKSVSAIFEFFVGQFPSSNSIAKFNY